MNRVIKFRGLRNDGEGWSHGYYLRAIDDKTKDVRCIIFPVETSVYENPVQVIPETVGQFTGLKDKNGDGIYEGDIVKWDDRSDEKYWRIAVTKINPDIQFDCFGISEYMGIENSSQYCFRYGNFIYKDTNNHLEIIGNIHEESEVHNG